MCLSHASYFMHLIRDCRAAIKRGKRWKERGVSLSLCPLILIHVTGSKMDHNPHHFAKTHTLISFNTLYLISLYYICSYKLIEICCHLFPSNNNNNKYFYTCILSNYLKLDFLCPRPPKDLLCVYVCKSVVSVMHNTSDIIAGWNSFLKVNFTSCSGLFHPCQKHREKWVFKYECICNTSTNATIRSVKNNE